nr:RNA-directed DNA polymerase, eukaryota, reverse transcriptase zinc-binding domain protein [Tanacetum cinerariifolium]
MHPPKSSCKIAHFSNAIRIFPRNISSSSDIGGLVVVISKLDNLRRDMKKLKENVHAVQTGCQICEGPHLDKECPLNKEVKQVDEVKYDINTLTMEQYLALSRENQAPSVVKPEIEGGVNFEIKIQCMQELREDTFSENKNEDAHYHVDQVLNIVKSKCVTRNTGKERKNEENADSYESLRRNLTDALRRNLFKARHVTQQHYDVTTLKGRSGVLISVWDPNYFAKDQIWCDDGILLLKVDGSFRASSGRSKFYMDEQGGWIHVCLRLARAPVLINGSPSSEFSMKRGLRQGDPLSPFLFIVIMEGLHITFKDAVSSGLIKVIIISDGDASLDAPIFSNSDSSSESSNDSYDYMSEDSSKALINFLAGRDFQWQFPKQTQEEEPKLLVVSMQTEEKKPEPLDVPM